MGNHQETVRKTIQAMTRVTEDWVDQLRVGDIVHIPIPITRNNILYGNYGEAVILSIGIDTNPRRLGQSRVHRIGKAAGCRQFRVHFIGKAARCDKSITELRIAKRGTGARVSCGSETSLEKLYRVCFGQTMRSDKPSIPSIPKEQLYAMGNPDSLQFSKRHVIEMVDFITIEMSLMDKHRIWLEHAGKPLIAWRRVRSWDETGEVWMKVPSAVSKKGECVDVLYAMMESFVASKYGDIPMPSRFDKRLQNEILQPLVSYLQQHQYLDSGHRWRESKATQKLTLDQMNRMLLKWAGEDCSKAVP